MVNFIIQLIFLIGNIAMAWYHAKLIKDHMPIYHGWWSGGYLLAVIVVCYLFSWWYWPVLLLLRGVVFSPALSLFRGLPINYISTRTTSLIDQFENMIFKDWYQRMIWLIGALIIFELLLIVLK